MDSEIGSEMESWPPTPLRTENYRRCDICEESVEDKTTAVVRASGQCYKIGMTFSLDRAICRIVYHDRGRGLGRWGERESERG